MGHRTQEIQICEPGQLGAGHAVLHEESRIAIETEEKRTRVRTYLADVYFEFCSLFLEVDHLFWGWPVDVHLPHEKSQIRCVAIRYDEPRATLQARKAPGLLIGHPEARV